MLSDPITDRLYDQQAWYVVHMLWLPTVSSNSKALRGLRERLVEEIDIRAGGVMAS